MIDVNLIKEIVRLTKPMRDTYYSRNTDEGPFTDYILYINHYLESILTSKYWSYDEKSGESYHPTKDCTLTGEMTGDYSMVIHVKFASGASFDILTGLTFYKTRPENARIHFEYANLVRADGTRIAKPTRTNLKPVH